ncbi:hypothetical protein [Actinomadura logoneensis]|uniref:hypothetical protein n=1 Tax=Actinomadura logoneensis TaxID=2293572 RepID=UPI001314F1D1|nr:hypothetical protein [Actinomadura logoneensis]
MRRSSFADRPERAVAPRTLSELLDTDEDVLGAVPRTRRAPRAARTLRNAT